MPHLKAIELLWLAMIEASFDHSHSSAAFPPTWGLNSLRSATRGLRRSQKWSPSWHPYGFVLLDVHAYTHTHAQYLPPVFVCSLYGFTQSVLLLFLHFWVVFFPPKQENTLNCTRWSKSGVPSHITLGFIQIHTTQLINKPCYCCNLLLCRQ